MELSLLTTDKNSTDDSPIIAAVVIKNETIVRFICVSSFKKDTALYPLAGIRVSNDRQLRVLIKELGLIVDLPAASAKSFGFLKIK